MWEHRHTFPSGNNLAKKRGNFDHKYPLLTYEAPAPSPSHLKLSISLQKSNDELVRKARRLFFVPHGNLAILYYKLQGVQNHSSSYFYKLWYLFPLFCKNYIVYIHRKLSTKAIKNRYFVLIDTKQIQTDIYVVQCTPVMILIVHLSVNSATRPNEHIMLL